MTDRELLELAAKAAGSDLVWCDAWKGMAKWQGSTDGFDWDSFWNPLTDDGDALRLAVKLGITVGPESPCVVGKSLCRVSWESRSKSLGEYGDGDPMAATRRAIVRAAAEIGRAMP